ncbi:hypothetical protein DdX_15451 [Ditylenchus destructor]|uniref:Uncharacterized protein n=1 Tax=Ditylenchus destructor TaxID=166010 RepID=A0AAD4QXR1_9BILA|nr:hypothetical protein DdX_15451 [Ditylenchus destructor]
MSGQKSIFHLLSVESDDENSVVEGLVNVLDVSVLELSDVEYVDDVSVLVELELGVELLEVELLGVELLGVELLEDELELGVELLEDELELGVEEEELLEDELLGVELLEDELELGLYTTKDQLTLIPSIPATLFHMYLNGSRTVRHTESMTICRSNVLAHKMSQDGITIEEMSLTHPNWLNVARNSVLRGSFGSKTLEHL